jgi:hypothetical protein
MKWITLQLLAFALTLSTFAANTADLVSEERGLAVLQKNCIRLGTNEVLPIQFSTACSVLENKELLHAVQAEFVRSISDNGTVDFPVIETAEGEYYYINEKGQRTDIVELYRQQTDAFSYDYIVMATSKRFFGTYDVIIHLQVVDAGQAGIVYSVSLHAWPHNWLTRSSHKVGLTRSFFKKKMKLIAWVARKVGTGLCEQAEMRERFIGGSAASTTTAQD